MEIKNTFTIDFNNNDKGIDFELIRDNKKYSKNIKTIIHNDDIEYIDSYEETYTEKNTGIVFNVYIEISISNKNMFYLLINEKIKHDNEYEDDSNYNGFENLNDDQINYLKFIGYHMAHALLKQNTIKELDKMCSKEVLTLKEIKEMQEKNNRIIYKRHIGLDIFDYFITVDDKPYSRMQYTLTAWDRKKATNLKTINRE